VCLAEFRFQPRRLSHERGGEGEYRLPPARLHCVLLGLIGRALRVCAPHSAPRFAPSLADPPSAQERRKDAEAASNIQTVREEVDRQRAGTACVAHLFPLFFPAAV